MDNIALYEGAMQAVPLLLIALFLDSRNAAQEGTPRSQWWERMQDRAFALLGVIAFMVSMFVVAGVTRSNPLLDAIVLAALSGCISLLLVQIWRRLERRRTRSAERPGAVERN
jgi:hypothetical protein